MRPDQVDFYLSEFERLSRGHMFLKKFKSWKKIQTMEPNWATKAIAWNPTALSSWIVPILSSPTSSTACGSTTS